MQSVSKEKIRMKCQSKFSETYNIYEKHFKMLSAEFAQGVVKVNNQDCM